VERIDKLRQTAGRISDGNHPDEYNTCGARFPVRRQVCSRCEGSYLDRSDWLASRSGVE
jgi:hypothetical protein